MNFTLYGSSNDDRSAKIRWLLEELEAPYKDKWLKMEEKENESEAYLQINPLGRIPALVMDEKPLFESGAVVAYLADRFITKSLAPALSSRDRSEYQQWMYLANSTIDSFVGRIMIIEDIPAGPIFNTKMVELLSEIKDCADLLNKTVSKKDYLLGGFSAADVCMGHHLHAAMLWPEIKEIFDVQPKLVAYLERLKNRPAAIKAKAFRTDPAR